VSDLLVTDGTHELHGDALATLRAWAINDPLQQALRDEYIDFLASHNDGHLKSCLAGHLTASALIIEPVSERVLLTLHPKVSRWLQTGGHLEPADASVRSAAAREAFEESGIDGLVLSKHPVRLDKHLVPCRPDVVLHHLDVQYLAIAPHDAREMRSAESLDLRWFDANDLPETDDSVRALVTAALDSLTRQNSDA
jgi:8-oxo-dGTP pyrophosphatase MutT (NUDIX family)